MTKPFELKEETERLILVGVQEQAGDDTEDSVCELGDLVRTAGGEPVGSVIQRREKIHPGTYVGTGKIEELRMMADALEATGIVCDDELSPAQMNNLQQELNLKVMDRTLVILDIFARHAVTSEGKIQVELAQLRYRAAHLKGMGRSLSRLGGGIGTRGPGEKKLEVDRRRIHERIGQLKRELAEVVKHRELIRTQRKRSNKKVAALAGYSSSGKSSIENYLTNAGIQEDAKLFSTLDTTTRALQLSGKQEILLTDTVGFIRKLPHHLIEAFRSTLEEVCYADIIIHVVDASNPQMEAQMRVVYETLRQLKAEDKPVITVFNKQDKLDTRRPFTDPNADYVILTSARTGQGMEELKLRLEQLLRRNQIYVERMYPYSQAGILQMIRTQGELLEEKYLDEGISVRAYVPKEIYGKV
ncbi:MAG TPA: GTPase HflX [Candidatus Fusicatenibacter intestinigallinarum]|uniref:GTPase HflX n=1 Tax=Candidatus Fusicatenibacter intestinigallinarum TaxID=2838598 RepID=A0A9D2NB53_9FIRM|nr:GTPase HflX [Candidatus Fusicatenibacter intestinigallinarum]